MEKFRSNYLLYQCLLLMMVLLVASGGCEKEKKVYVPAPAPTPDRAINPTPANCAIRVPLNQQLSWDTVTNATEYVVHFGMTDPPAMIGCQSTTTFDPGILSGNTLYFWRIDTVNSFGTTEGSVWSFCSIGNPPLPGNPNPVNNATGVLTDTDLSWGALDDASHYDVYFGTTSPGTYMGCVSGTIFDPGTLNPSTKYYWRIDPVNCCGTTCGPVWSFFTEGPPQQATNPSPSNSLTDVPTNPICSWEAEGATSYKVFFGTTAPGSEIGTISTTSFNPGCLKGMTTYYWRIDTVNSFGNTTGHQWSFRTGAEHGFLDWAKQAGGGLWDQGQAVSALPDGTSYVTGALYTTAGPVFGERDKQRPSVTHRTESAQSNTSLGRSRNTTRAEQEHNQSITAEFRLQDTSPCIETGCNSYIDSLIPALPTDLDGNTRKMDSSTATPGGTVDMGPYEFQGIKP